MKQLVFDNRAIRELPGDPNTSPYPRQVLGAFWSAVQPKVATAPTLVAHAAEVAKLLDLSPADIADDAFVQAFSGTHLLPGMQPYASCYGGHQFGQWAGQLGDGRAIGLGEVINQKGERWELQLKGAGLTPYARRGDGLAVLRSSLREFLCSEAMFHLGIPTTRALSLITTGESVIRDMFYDGNAHPEPGAVVCRVAPSFIRFGHFEIFARRGEKKLLKQLVDFTLSRDFPELAATDYGPWFMTICARTAQLMVEWYRVGFVHGVMNTDNMSILGLTIDYGPYGWLENFDPAWTPNTTDAQGRRYCFGHQASIARWNLERLADAVSSLLPQDDLQAGLAHFDRVYITQLTAMLAEKLGWLSWRETDIPLVEELFSLMQTAEVDMTEFFRRLADINSDNPEIEIVRPAFYREDLFLQHCDRFSNWLGRYAQRVEENETRRSRMNRINPRFILRNYIAQQAIDRSEQGDHRMVHELLELLKTPYADDPGQTRWYAIRPEWARHKAGCSLLSCSS